MKIIDLLNKIANGEETPKKIKFENYIYDWRNMQQDYFCKKINHSLESIIGEYLFNNLNLEIEIIEEDKKIKKFEMMYPISQEFNSEIGGLISIYNSNLSNIKITIDKLIDAVNELKDSDN